MTFHEFFFQCKPNISNLRVFGCLDTYIHLKKKERKWNFFNLLIGYDTENNAYIIYYTNEKRILISKDIIFDKQKIGYSFLDHTIANKQEIFSFNSMTNNHTSEDEV